MKILLCAATLLFFLSGCAGPRFDGTPIEPSLASSEKGVVVVMNSETRPGFLEAVEEWLVENGHRYTVAPDRSEHQPDKITLQYVGRWSWDLALFLSVADISAFHEGQRIGRVEYRAPNSLNMAKFGEGSERIKYMMDVLFGRLTPSEAARRVRSPEQENGGSSTGSPLGTGQ